MSTHSQSRNKSRIIALVVIAACAFGTWQLAGFLFGERDAQRDHVEHVVNQIWLDHMPEDARDIVAHLVLVDDSRHQVGITGRSSQWRHRLEVLGWRLRGSTLRVFFPQDQMRSRVKVATWDCTGEAPEPFELCLKIRNREGKSATLYSRKDWVINPESKAAQLRDLDRLAESVPALGGMIENIRSVLRRDRASMDAAASESSDWSERALIPLVFE